MNNKTENFGAWKHFEFGHVMSVVAIVPQKEESDQQ